MQLRLAFSVLCHKAALHRLVANGAQVVVFRALGRMCLQVTTTQGLPTASRARHQMVRALPQMRGQQIHVAALPVAALRSQPHTLCPEGFRVVLRWQGYLSIRFTRSTRCQRRLRVQLTVWMVRAPNLQVVHQPEQGPVALSQRLPVSRGKGSPASWARQAWSDAVLAENVVARRLHRLVQDAHAHAAKELFSDFLIIWMNNVLDLEAHQEP
mmetsp:Transcript_50696/g.117707  ORF Transcript_50696/g.117707 Transcript_50696/m.117707 type:complete len:212 (-) Transcript_50696:75-710(-)